MGLMEMLGLGNRKKGAAQKPSAPDAERRAREDKIPPAAQDMCCGSCGGQRHGSGKDRQE